jgi:DNA-binding NarL/FixJ family response regulator
MRVILADDDRNVRSALRLLLEKELEFEVAGEAADGQDLLVEAESAEPDLVLFDWELPGLKTAEMVAELRACCPRAILISLSGRLEARQAALGAGVDAFVSKGDPPERVLDILQRVISENGDGSESC